MSIQRLFPFPDDDWYDLNIPLDLSDWESLDTCVDDQSGVRVKGWVLVDNRLSDDQGDGPVRDAVLVDRICVDGTLLSVDPANPAEGYRLWPNPGRETVRVVLPEPALPGTLLRMVNLTGQTVAEQVAAIGQSEQDMTTSDLSPGMYFLVIERNGMARAILRWVCQE